MHRVAKFDDQKMSEDNQKLRCGCPPDYPSFGGDKNNLIILDQQFLLSLCYFNTNISLTTDNKSHVIC